MIIVLTVAYFIAAGWLADTFGLVKSFDPAGFIGSASSNPTGLELPVWAFAQILNFAKLALFQVDGVYYIANLCLLLGGIYLTWKALKFIRGSA